MKRNLLIVILFALAACALQGQPVLEERTIPIKSYDLRQGSLYPFGVTEGPENCLAMLQYWPSDPFHTAENIYLQAHRLQDYSLKWDGPATEPGREPMEVNELQRLERCFAIIGRQYVPREKRIVSVARFYDLEGKALATDPEIISSYRGKPGKDLSQQTLVSPGRRCMLWEGRDGSDYYASAWNSDGRKLWAEELEIPHLGKYRLKQTAIADDGTLFLLLIKDKLSYALKDTAYPPLLLAYDARKKQFVTDTIQVDSAYAVDAWLSILPTGDPVVTGAWSRGPASLTINQYNAEGDKQYWGGFFLQRTHFEGGELLRDTTHQDSMPKAWLEEFGAVGARFADFRLIPDPDKVRRLILIAEERIVTNEIVERGRLGLVAFDPLYGNIAWSLVLAKKQRDRGTERFLSYVPMVAKGKLHLVYLSEVGAPGKLMVSSLGLGQGSYSKTVLADNFDTGYLFIPESSGPINDHEMVLVGLGDPSKSDFKFLRITF